MSSKKLTPVNLVIERFGGAGIGLRHLGRLLGGSPFTVAVWKHRRLSSIPNRNDMQARLLQLARDQKVKLTAEEIINGGAP